MKFIETSAKNALNVEDSFVTMTKEIIEIKSKTKESEDKNKDKGMKIGQGTKIDKDSKGCCGKS